MPSPSAHDPARNRHRDGRAWSKSAVRAILANPRYTGRQVWNRQRRDEVLLDVDDVAAGHQVKLRWNDRDAWIWSAEPTHDPLVDGDTFAKAAEIAAASAHRPAAAKRRTTARHYPLSGLIHCSACGRRMQGTYAHGTSRYRCRYPSEYAIANQLHHPLTVYVREDALAGPLDRWIAALFAPDQLDATCAALAAAGDGDEAADARAEAARRLVADCDQRLARYRGALDAGADPAVVAQWMAEVRGDRLRAEAELAAAAPAEPLAEAELRELRALVADLGSLAAELQREDPTARTRTYQALGVHLTYDHTNGLVTATATATPCSTARVGGGT